MQSNIYGQKRSHQTNNTPREETKCSNNTEKYLILTIFNQNDKICKANTSEN